MPDATLGEMTHPTALVQYRRCRHARPRTKSNEAGERIAALGLPLLGLGHCGNVEAMVRPPSCFVLGTNKLGPCFSCAPSRKMSVIGRPLVFSNIAR
jgi:hypothetical protein